MATAAWEEGNGEGDMQLQLAEKMMEKTLKSEKEGDPKLTNPEELLLYIQIMEQQGKMQAAANLLANPQGEAISGFMQVEGNPSGWELQQILATMQLKLKAYPEAQSIYQALLKADHPDNWAFWVGHLDATLAGEGATAENVTATLALAMEISASDPRLRGPCLLPLEAVSRRYTAGDATALAELMDLLVGYIERFGSKSCCGGDVKSYLHLIPLESRKGLRDMMASKAALEEDTDLKALTKLQKRITREGIYRWLGSGVALSSEELKTKGVSLIEGYHASLPLNEGMEPSERGHGDSLLLLGALYLVDAWRFHGDTGSLLHAMALLKKGAKDSIHNFEYRVVLMRLLIEVGAVSEAYDLFIKLDVKHVQYESLAHELIIAVVTSGLLKEARAVSGRTLYFHNEALREVPDYTANSYKYQNYSKVSEFVDFGKKLKNSVTCASAAARIVSWHHVFTNQEGAIVGSLKNALERLSIVDTSQLISNEDRHCIPRYDALPAGKMEPKWGGAIPQETQARVAAAVYTAKGLDGANAGKLEAVGAALKELEALVGEGPEVGRSLVLARVGMLRAVSSLKNVMNGEAEEGTAVVEGIDRATEAVEAAKKAAIVALTEATAEAEAVAGGVAGSGLKLEAAAEFLQDICPVVLLLAKVAFETLPAAKKKKGKAAPLKEGVQKVRDALKSIVNTVGAGTQEIQAGVQGLRKALTTCGKTVSGERKGVDEAAMKEICNLVVKSQQEACNSLLGTTKELVEQSMTALKLA